MSAAEAGTSKEIDTSAIPSTSDERHHVTEETLSQIDVLPEPSHDTGETSIELECDFEHQSAVSPGCPDCALLLNRNRKLSNKIKTSRQIVTKRRQEANGFRRKSKLTEYKNYWTDTVHRNNLLLWT